MNYSLLSLLIIAIFVILPSHWRKLKIKRDKILTIAFLVLFLVIMLLNFFYPKAKRTIWEGRIIIISLVILLFMIFISIAEFISLKKTE
jgi:type II secretory pathway component PulM